MLTCALPVNSSGFLRCFCTMSDVETSPPPARQSAKQSPSPPPTSGSASVVEKILKRKNKDGAQKEKDKAKESKKKRARAAAVDDDRGRFSRFEAVASEVIALTFEYDRCVCGGRLM